MRVLSIVCLLLASIGISLWLVGSGNWDFGSITFIDVVRAAFSRDVWIFFLLVVGMPVMQFILGRMSRDAWTNGKKLMAVLLASLLSLLFFLHIPYAMGWGGVTNIMESAGDGDGSYHFGKTESECMAHLFELLILPLVAGMLWKKKGENHLFHEFTS